MGGARGEKRRRGDEVRATRETGGARGSHTWELVRMNFDWLVFSISQNVVDLKRHAVHCVYDGNSYFFQLVPCKDVNCGSVRTV